MDPELTLHIAPGIGALPLKFGMSPKEIESLLNRSPDRIQEAYLQGFTEVFYNFPFLKLTFSKTNGLHAVELIPEGGVSIEINNRSIFTGDNYSNGIKEYLSSIDSDIVDEYGITSFRQIGISIPTELDDKDGSFCVSVIEEPT